MRRALPALMVAISVAAVASSSKAVAGGGGGACHYPDIATHVCTGTLDAKPLTVIVSEYVGHATGSYVKHGDQVLAYMGYIDTRIDRVAEGQLVTMKSTKLAAAPILAQLYIEKDRADAPGKLTGTIGTVDVKELALDCKYSYRVQC